MSDRYATIAVPVPHLDPLTYRLPAGIQAVIGSRVLVPLGSRRTTGCVLETLDRMTGPVVEVKDVLEVWDEEPYLKPDLIDLVRWVADYYLCGIGDVLAAAVPSLAWVEAQLEVSATDTGISAGPDLDPRRDPVGVAILESLRAGERCRRPTLVARAQRWLSRHQPSARRIEAAAIERRLRTLVGRGLVRLDRAVLRDANAFSVRRVARLARPLPTADAERLTAKQRVALQLIAEADGAGVPVDALAARAVTPGVIRRLVERGLAVWHEEVIDRDPFARGGETLDHVDSRAPPLSLTDEQTHAVARVEDELRRGLFGVTLLHGVTGSGKTEVYLHVARAACAVGRRVLVLVPEIALTPAVAGRFRSAFGNDVAILHSGLSDGERHDQWHRIRRGEIAVVVGTRSAVFAPLDALGLVIVDEEHDGSYKQEEAPRYHARDVALVRAQRAAAHVVLGSATPSLEAYSHSEAGRFTRIELTRRVEGRRLARVEIVNMREEYAARGADVVLSERLREALVDRLSKGEQAVILLNRRGYATSVFCRQCGHILECPNCSVTLTAHRAAGRARCHYCDFALRLTERCASCGAPYVDYTGVGTERVEAEVVKTLPGVRVARVDRDTIRKRGAIGELLSRFARRELDVLVGTQMIAKGHDFPAVTLVGVVSADVGLGLADFRAAERTFQLLTQVAGRAGRGEQAGEAIVQTLFPDHYSIVFARSQDYRAFFEHEMAYRRAMRYPPVTSLVNVIVRARTPAEALRDARTFADTLGREAEGFRLLGPAPAPLGKLRGDYRAQLLLKAVNRRQTREAIRQALRAHPTMRRRLTVDVDPLSML